MNNRFCRCCFSDHNADDTICRGFLSHLSDNKHGLRSHSSGQRPLDARPVLAGRPPGLPGEQPPTGGGAPAVPAPGAEGTPAPRGPRATHHTGEAWAQARIATTGGLEDKGDHGCSGVLPCVCTRRSLAHSLTRPPVPPRCSEGLCDSQPEKRSPSQPPPPPSEPHAAREAGTPDPRSSGLLGAQGVRVCACACASVSGAPTAHTQGTGSGPSGPGSPCARPAARVGAEGEQVLGRRAGGGSRGSLVLSKAPEGQTPRPAVHGAGRKVPKEKLGQRVSPKPGPGPRLRSPPPAVWPWASRALSRGTCHPGTDGRSAGGGPSQLPQGAIRGHPTRPAA